MYVNCFVCVVLQCALCKIGTTMELLFLKYNEMWVNFCVVEHKTKQSRLFGIPSFKTKMGKKKLGVKFNQ